MWSLIKGLFTVKSAESIVEGVKAGVDKSFFTSEEKSDMAFKFVDRLYDQFTPRAISRRILAVWFCILYGLVFIAGAVLILVRIDQGVIDALFTWTDKFRFPWIIGAIVVFYFGLYAIDKAKK